MPFEPGGVVKFPARPPARTVRCGRVVPRAHRAVASVFIPMKPCCRSRANASRPPKGARSCASALQWNTPWPMLVAGKADAPATVGCGRMCLICDDVQSFIIYTCWHA